MLWYERNSLTYEDFFNTIHSKISSDMNTFLRFIADKEPDLTYFHISKNNADIVIVPPKIKEVSSILYTAEYLMQEINEVSMNFSFADKTLSYYIIRTNLKKQTVSMWRVSASRIFKQCDDSDWCIASNNKQYKGIWTPDAKEFYYTNENHVYPLSFKYLVKKVPDTIRDWLIEWYKTCGYILAGEFQKEPFYFWEKYKVPNILFKQFMTSSTKQELFQQIGLNGTAADNNRSFIVSYYIKQAEKYIDTEYLKCLESLSENDFLQKITSYTMQYNIIDLIKYAVGLKIPEHNSSHKDIMRYIHIAVLFNKRIDLTLSMDEIKATTLCYEVEYSIKKIPVIKQVNTPEVALPKDIKLISNKRQFCKCLRQNKIILPFFDICTNTNISEYIYGLDEAGCRVDIDECIKMWQEGHFIFGCTKYQNKNYLVIFSYCINKKAKHQNICLSCFSVIPEKNYDITKESDIRKVYEHLQEQLQKVYQPCVCRVNYRLLTKKINVTPLSKYNKTKGKCTIMKDDFDISDF